MLKIGERAPIFTAEGTKGRFDLRDYLGKKYIVLIFYPRNHSSLCAKQLSAARDAKHQYSKLNTIVVGINQASLQDHMEFALKQHYDFPLLHDENLLINRLYEVGNAFMRLTRQQRSVIVIGKDGLIHYAEHGPRSNDEIMEAIRLSSKVVYPK
ncbi:MAG: redoxin domain-containing protein [Gorillibacterium sp.]|nr:redoxin domain-containing protein [Gorillibacterium sp.]